MNMLALDPLGSRGSLRLRLSVRPGKDAVRVAESLESAELPRREHVVFHRDEVVRARGRVAVVDVVMSLRALLEDTRGAEQISQRLAEHVLAVVDAIC